MTLLAIFTDLALWVLRIVSVLYRLFLWCLRWTLCDVRMASSGSVLASKGNKFKSKSTKELFSELRSPAAVAVSSDRSNRVTPWSTSSSPRPRPSTSSYWMIIPLFRSFWLQIIEIDWYLFILLLKMEIILTLFYNIVLYNL